MPRRHNVLPAFNSAVIGRVKQARRDCRRRDREFQKTRAIWVINQMVAKPEEIEWRVLVITAPDTRTLTGRLLGDPLYPRSALYFKRMNHG